MVPLIRLVVGPREEPELFVPFPKRRHDIGALQSALPELQEELSRRWPIKDVKITYRFPNPSPGTLATIIGTAEGIVVLFLSTAAVTGGRQFGKDVGKQVAAVVNKWLKRMEPRKKKAARSRKGRPR